MQHSLSRNKACRKAAKQGSIVVQISLGMFWEKGDRVPNGNFEAHMQVRLAAAQGVEKELQSRDIIAGRMSIAEVIEG